MITSRNIRFLFVLMVVLSALGAKSSETTSSSQSVGFVANEYLENSYPPRTAQFSRGYKAALSYTNRKWLDLSIQSQGKHIFFLYQALTSAHSLDFSQSLLTCKAYRESLVSCGFYSETQGKRVQRGSCKQNGLPINKKFFHPQKVTSVPTSTAGGLSQVTKTTAVDLFARGRWFRSKVEGFEAVTNGEDFHQKMAGNMVAQLELGLAVLEQKRRDGKFTSSTDILAAYYGSGSKSCNLDYATRVLACESCMIRDGVTLRCLDRALGREKGC